jgi:hypothetical protein
MPVELWMKMAGNLDLGALSSFSSACRGFHYLFAGDLLPRHVEKARSEEDRVTRISEVFLHAARIDSTRILDQLTTNYRNVVGFVSFIPFAGLPGATLLDFALAADAPRVARHLIRTGCDFDLAALRALPGLKSLALALGGCYGTPTSPTTTDSALRTAIDFAMPRTARFLLTRGADANAKAGGVGEPLLHAALQWRYIPGPVEEFLPLLGDRVQWQQGRLRVRYPARCGVGMDTLMVRYGPALSPLVAVSKLLGGPSSNYQRKLSHEELLSHDVLSTSAPSATDRFWQHKVGQTVTALLDFGAHIDTRTPPAVRAHTCTHRCWCWAACHYGGQTPLHLAAAANFADAIPPLLARDPAAFQTPDAGGYTALYTAIVRGNLDAALALLHAPCAPGPNPPVLAACSSRTSSNSTTTATTTATTALHVAARLAFFPVVHALLERGADPNTLDSTTGRAPLHELLWSGSEERVRDVGREWDVLATLEVLRAGGADFEARVGGAGGGGGSGGKTAQEMGEDHPLPTVRARFARRQWRPGLGRWRSSWRKRGLVRVPGLWLVAVGMMRSRMWSGLRR